MSPLIYVALSNIMSKVGVISKDRSAGQNGDKFSYKFRGIDDVMNELHRHFADEQITILPEVLETDRTERVQIKTSTYNGKTEEKETVTFYTTVKVKFTFAATDGSTVCVTTVGEGMDTGDKSTNKAMSAALKYALLQMFLIPTAEPKDSENDEHTIVPDQNKADSELPWLSELQKNKMIEYVQDGKIQEVEAAMVNYRIKRAWRDEITATIDKYRENNNA
jgi:hypothetical protein